MNATVRQPCDSSAVPRANEVSEVLDDSVQPIAIGWILEHALVVELRRRTTDCELIRNHEHTARVERSVRIIGGGDICALGNEAGLDVVHIVRPNDVRPGSRYQDVAVGSDGGFRFRLDRACLGQFANLSATQLDRQQRVQVEPLARSLRTQIRGEIVGQFREREERVDIRVRSSEVSRNRATSVEDLREGVRRMADFFSAR